MPKVSNHGGAGVGLRAGVRSSLIWKSSVLNQGIK